MKNVNMKKIVAGVAALGVASLFAGAVVASNVGSTNGFTTPTKDDIFTAGMPNYTIVVGTLGEPRDVVSAAGIAAAIGSKAYKSTTAPATVTGGTFSSAQVEVGSLTNEIIAGDGKLTDDWVLGTESTEQLDDDDYSLLGDYDVKVDDDKFNDNEENVKDSLAVTATVKFDSDKDVADLTATINKKDIDYVIDFTPAIKDEADDTGSPDFKFNIMGKKYTLEKWDGTTLTLRENLSLVPYNVGESFEVDGYTITVDEILESSSTGVNYEVQMTLSQDDTEIASEVFSDGELIFPDQLTTDTEIDTVYNSKVTVVSGTSPTIKLKHGQVIKNFPNIGDELWYSDFVKTGSDLESITIYNNDNDVEWKNEDALRVGDEIVLPNDFAKIQFKGLTSESTKTVSIEDGILSYTDAQDYDHDLFVYEEETGTYDDGDTYVTSQEIDGKPLYFDFNTTDADLTSLAVYGGAGSKGFYTVQLEDSDGKYLDYDGSTWTWVSGTPDATNKFAYTNDVFTDITIPLYNNNAELIDYGLFISESSATVIDQIAIGLKNGATGTLETGQTWIVGNTYYQIDTDGANNPTYVGDADGTATTVVTTDMTSMFELIVKDSVDTVTAHIDAYTGDLVDTDDSSYLAVVDQVLVDLGTDATVDYTLNQEDSDDLRWGYTEFGSKAEVDGGLFTIEVPEKQLYGQIFIGGGSSESYEEITSLFTFDALEKLTDDETKLSAKLVKVEVTPGTGTCQSVSPVSFSATNLVKLDTAAPAGKKIIVGGQNANNLAKIQYGLEDLLTQSGNYVMGKATNGDIVVAGYNWEDTQAAAEDLIDIIEGFQQIP